MFCPKCRIEYRKGFSTCVDCEIPLVNVLPPEPQPKLVTPRAKSGWNCPECGLINIFDISKCVCGYDSNRSITNDSYQGKGHGDHNINVSHYGRKMDLKKQEARSAEIPYNKYKTFWPRFWAGWIDSTIFIPLMVIDHFVWKGHGSLPVLLTASWYIAYSFSFSIYSILMHGKYGQTLGKMAMRVKVLDVSENRLSMYQAIKRDIVLLSMTAVSVIHDVPRIMSGINIYDPTETTFDISFLILMNATMLWFLAEIVTMLFNNKRRAVHDFIAKSVVVRLPKKNNAS